MRNYSRYEEDLDEYEDEEGYQLEEEAEEEHEEYEEEPPRQPTQEELDYLELRQRLKESIRKKRKMEGVSSLSTQEKMKRPYDNYGSFFGPSQPVISQRVVQESKSLIENQHLASRMLKGQNTSKKTSSTSMGSKPANGVPPLKVNNGLQTKLQTLKDTRDYSFLLSDDAELPAPTRQPPPRNASGPISDAKSAQFQQKSKESSGKSGRLVNGSHQDRKAVGMNGYERPLGPNRPTSGKATSTTDLRKQIVNHGSGPGRALGPKGLPSKTPTSLEKKPSVSGVKRDASGAQKPPFSMILASVSKPCFEQRREPQELDKSMLIKKQSVPTSKSQINKPVKSISSHAAEKRKVSSHPVDQRRVVSKAPVQKEVPRHVSLQDNRPKKRPARPFDDDDDDEDGGKAISMIRKMFGYNPNKYRDDDDDSDMEAGFDDIMKEEKRSALIARKEDEEQLRLIEEEERREMLRKKMAKKRKLMSH